MVSASQDATAFATIEAWARAFVLSESAAHKRAPGPPPERFAVGEAAAWPTSPGRPPSWRVAQRSGRVRGLTSPRARASLLHRFWHHELQAAELMAWAILRFPTTPERFRRGLLGIARDELRHMARYEEHIVRLGYAIGDFPIRDWFWERARDCETPTAFLAFVGLGLEGGNLDHSARFAERFRTVGDEVGAAIQDEVGAEEVAHVRFALRWFREFEGGAPSFEAFTRALPPPLSPILFRGRPIARERRRAAGLDAAFIDALERFEPELQ